jgi:hypothetical protein
VVDWERLRRVGLDTVMVGTWKEQVGGEASAAAEVGKGGPNTSSLLLFLLLLLLLLLKNRGRETSPHRSLHLDIVACFLSLNDRLRIGAELGVGVVGVEVCATLSCTLFSSFLNSIGSMKRIGKRSEEKKKVVVSALSIELMRGLKIAVFSPDA